MWSVIVDNLVHAPRFSGPLEGATHEGVAGDPGEGPHLRLWLRMDGDHILHAAYHTYGCPAAIASGEMLCLLLVGRTRAQAQRLTVSDLIRVLGGLPEGKEHCPQLALSALNKCLAARPRDAAATEEIRS